MIFSFTKECKASEDNENSEYLKRRREEFEKNSFFDLRTTKGQILFLAVSTIIASLVPQLPLHKLGSSFLQTSSPNVSCPNSKQEYERREKPTYWIYGSGGDGQWVHVNNVLKRLGFERVTENESSTADLLWVRV